MAIVKRILIGKPIATADEGHQRISKKIALPVFASDAISSTAYATDEILVVLLAQAGIGLRGVQQPGADRRSIVAVLLAIVVTSYRQTIFAYPSGGGSYIVSRRTSARSRRSSPARSLLVDYILTVAVSRGRRRRRPSARRSASTASGRVADLPRVHRPDDARPTCAA